MKYSFVIPVYGSGSALRELTAKIRALYPESEIVFVDDRGNAQSWKILQELSASDSRIIAVRLARNFGQHNALMCGFTHATGEIIVTLDDDLQNPVEEVPALVSALAPNINVVYGIPKIKQHSYYRNFFSTIIQVVYKKTFRVHNRISSFRVIRATVAKQILRYNRSFTFVDGLLAWHTNALIEVPVQHDERRDDRSGYSIGKLVLHALNIFTNFSVFPLQVMSVAGTIFSGFAFLIGSYLLLRSLIIGIPVPGYTSIIVCLLFFSGVQLLCFGMLGEYLGRILMNVNEKPQFVVDTVCKKGVVE